MNFYPNFFSSSSFGENSCFMDLYFTIVYWRTCKVHVRFVTKQLREDGLESFVAVDGLESFVAVDGLERFVAEDGLERFVAEDGL